MASNFSTMQSSKCYSPITASKSRPPQSVSLVKLATGLFYSKQESKQSNKTSSRSTSPASQDNNLQQSSRHPQSQSSTSYSSAASASVASSTSLSRRRSPTSALQQTAQTQQNQDRSQNVLAGDRAFVNQATLGRRINRPHQEGKSTAWERIGQRRAKASGDWQL